MARRPGATGEGQPATKAARAARPKLSVAEPDIPDVEVARAEEPAGATTAEAKPVTLRARLSALYFADGPAARHFRWASSQAALKACRKLSSALVACAMRR